ncbi:ABC transporter ATP-binding protein [Limnofasciculus baicalensis]|uniref:ABC transporter ATP-binding protein n=1 Tax=Limnofasciculus baicalensis BBK-W-15 TaxID=2699891 RepID=A0AAE3KSA6_9CYAN|nr:ABC transporter ATP-binding protein [Limnofasciculus baicalensis]MCP2732463.1 ABC transporter ATP-binding protein [Limnofasciculus baicalensis BBK-W-15]
MSDTVIQVDNLGKKYIIGHQKQENYTALRDVIANGVKGLGRKLLKPWGKSFPNPASEEFWALKDVSFEIKQGDRVGIIGRNGAGKSTLLKILSRITEPTTGSIRIKGRVASLLEVGTGFHPELTGRENIFLNGAILGMSRLEIKRKFDEIVAFAEVEKFLDTPVKRYSSGMYVRLAFAVAAHLEPEILVVDEVLAVGDAAFQKKCLGKMEDVGKEGRTVLFVSHQMAAIEKLCSRVVVLRSGQIKFDGDNKSSINFYLIDLEEQTRETKLTDINRSGTGDIILTGFSIENSAGNNLVAAACGEELVLVFHYKTNTNNPLKNVSLGFSIHNGLGDTISVFYSDYAGTTFSSIPHIGKIKCRIQDFPYSKGRYLVGARITVNGVEADWPKGYIGFIDVEAGDFYKTGNVALSGIGVVLIRGDWYLAA